MRAIVLALALYATPAHAAEWSTFDVHAQGATLTVLALDWSQTLHLARVGKESNPVLGQRPSVAAVSAYFVGAALLHTGVAHALPRGYRTLWQALWFTVEAGTVQRNHQFGVRLALP